METLVNWENQQRFNHNDYRVPATDTNVMKCTEFIDTSHNKEMVWFVK